MRCANSQGFSLIELMIVVVVIGILAAIAIPNYISMEDRAKEGSTKANMHTLQLAAEDFGVQNEGSYSTTVGPVVQQLPSDGANFENPFTSTQGAGVAYEDRGDGNLATAPAAISGISSYADSAQLTYNIKGYGRKLALPLILTAGE